MKIHSPILLTDLRYMDVLIAKNVQNYFPCQDEDFLGESLNICRDLMHPDDLALHARLLKDAFNIHYSLAVKERMS